MVDRRDIFSNLSGTNDWSRKTGTFTTSAATAYVRVRAALGLWGTAKGEIWFDGVLLEKGGVIGSIPIWLTKP